MKIGYFAGPGDICKTYRDWLVDAESSSDSSYSAQFYNLTSSNIKGYAISSNDRREIIDGGNLIVENLPFKNDCGGLLHIVKGLGYKLRVALRFRKFGAKVAFIQSDYDMWGCIVFPVLGIKVVNSVHCEIERVGVINSFLNKIFLRFFSSGVMCVSNSILEYVNRVSSGLRAISFLPSHAFSKLSPDAQRASRNIFSLSANSADIIYLYVGRIESNKGVFTLLNAFAEVVKLFPCSRLYFCGNGSELNKLKNAVLSMGLGDVVLIVDELEYFQLLDYYAFSDVVVVPTSIRFSEGFNKVAFEASFLGRSAIVSNVCPAVDEIDGLYVVPPDDHFKLVESMIELRDSDLRRRLVIRSQAGVKNFLKSKDPWSLVAKKFLT